MSSWANDFIRILDESSGNNAQEVTVDSALVVLEQVKQQNERNIVSHMDDFYTYGIVNRPQIEQWLARAFREGSPPELHIILGNTSNPDEWQGLDFADANLGGSIMTQANLSHGIFRDAHLEGVEFTWSVLHDCDFTGATL